MINLLTGMSRNVCIPKEKGFGSRIQGLFNDDSMHGRRKVHDYFLLILYKSSIWFTEKHIFKIIIFFFNTSKCATNCVISFEVYDGFIGQKILKL